MNKKLIYLFMTLGVVAGSYLPLLWGASMLGGWSILGGMVGGFGGIWVGAKLSKRFS